MENPVDEAIELALKRYRGKVETPHGPMEFQGSHEACLWLLQTALDAQRSPSRYERLRKASWAVLDSWITSGDVSAVKFANLQAAIEAEGE